jgi:hypothetical protein
MAEQDGRHQELLLYTPPLAVQTGGHITQKWLCCCCSLYKRRTCDGCSTKFKKKTTKGEKETTK